MNKLIIYFITILNNSILQNKQIVKVNNTKIILNIVYLLYRKGLISKYFIINNKIIIHLKYISEKPIIKKIKYISKPSFKKYLSIKKSYLSLDIIILNTNIGIVDSIEAKKKNIGGELLFLIK